MIERTEDHLGAYRRVRTGRGRARRPFVDTAGLDIRHDTVDGSTGAVPVRRYRTSGVGEGSVAPTVVWVHGGAFSHGGLDQLESHAVAVALARGGVDVVAVDYRRVPPWNPFRDAGPAPLAGIRYPLPLDDVAASFEAVLAAVDAAGGAVFLGGASAGACLSAAASLRAVRTGRRVPAGLLLAYGTYHAELPPITSELRSRIRGRHSLVQFRPATVRRMNRNYAGTVEAVRDPFAFPGGHDLTGMPPVLMLDADRDSLRASGDAFADGLAAAGVPVERHVIAGSTHGFLDRPRTDGFDEGIDRMRAWLARPTERTDSA
ncbi:acetyl esterase [Agromyces sp. CF514]|uniref:alpha/beta hydrolase fold domain-containing protein n=1 Tax=Agromyces sp. CF514 TaxID=1881031 RepID=UPI0008EA4EB0|nr:alpha/beta hydrolase fold domain-containing protein [Agromyces sp. CF514]SFR78420.1 acetyl esterase [Agromyces sp. CF514]